MSTIIIITIPPISPQSGAEKTAEVTVIGDPVADLSETLREVADEQDA